MKFKIEKTIFEKWPQVKIGVVIALGLDNTKGKDKTVGLLREEEKKIEKEFRDKDIGSQPFVSCWREAYRNFGASPKKYPSLIESLLRRVAGGGRLPDINPLVNLYNFLSLRYLLPFGGEDLDKIRGNVELCFAKGDEKGKYVGGDKEETALPGEVIYKDQVGFIYRRWNWREADRTKFTPKTENAILVVEALPPAEERQLKDAVEELAELVKKFLGGKVEVFILDKDKALIEFKFKSISKKRAERGPDKKRGSTETLKKQRLLTGLVEEEKGKWKLDLPKDFLQYQLKKLIAEAASKIIDKKINPEEVRLEHPDNEKYGDYASNIAIAIFSDIKNQKLKIKNTNKKLKNFKTINHLAMQPFSSPRQLAEAIVGGLKQLKELSKSVKSIEAAGAGFINITIKNEWLIKELQKVVKQEKNYGINKALGGKKIMVEYAHPNTHKEFHIGHLRNICIGEAVCQILEACSAKIVRTNYQGDVGLHIAKSLWAILQISNFKSQISKLKTIKNKVEFLGKCYVAGSKVYEENKRAKKEILEINRQIYKKSPKVKALWQKTRRWSLDYFDWIYKRLGTKYDRLYFESEAAEPGTKNAKKLLEIGVLSKSQGAVVFKGEKYGLDTRVFLTKEGLPTYEAKELGLAPLEFSEFGKIDKCIHVVAPEQTSFFKVTFKVEELWDPKEFKDKQYHLKYGFVDLKEGKMSSRTGQIVAGMDVVDQTKKRVKKVMKESEVDDVEELAEQVAVGATKYTMLKQGVSKNMLFDIKESVSIQGDSAPYLQYTYARARSVLAKAQGLKLKTQSSHKLSAIGYQPNSEEFAVLRWLYRFPEIVLEAGQEYAPNLICNFLYKLAQRFNAFYNRHRILDVEAKSDFRLLLTAAVAQVLKNGLVLLGIKPLERM